MRARLLLPLLIACHSGSTAPPLTADALRGTYELLSVNGSPPPVTIFARDDMTVTLTGGSLQVGDGTLRERALYTVRTPTRTAPNDGFEDARYTLVSPSAFTFSRIRRQALAGGSGAIENGTLSLRRGDSIFVYIKVESH